MKKNAIGRVHAHEEPISGRIAALHIPSRLFCLFLAVVIWLAITNFVPSNEDSPKDVENPTTEQSV